MKRRVEFARPHQVVVVSDLHCGCRMGLHPNETVILHGGKPSRPSRLQKKVWSHWRKFWDDWVPSVTKGEPFILVVNGDALEGQPSGSKTPISLNVADQIAIGQACLAPEVKKAAAYYHIRGTENHVGKSAENEELLAKLLGAKPDIDGQFSRDFLWLDLQGHLVHFAHHVGTTGSRVYESTAPHKEYQEFLASSAQWGEKPPQLLVRSHRHRYIEPMGASFMGKAGCVVTPSWQLSTPYASRLLTGRSSEPQIGGILVRVGGRMGLYVATYVYQLERPQAEVYRG